MTRLADSPKSAAIYVRISQDREGRALGVERQEQDCRALAERIGCPVVAVYSDNDISASTRSKKVRPEYRQLIADAKAGHFGLVIAYTSGRLTRKPREHEDLIELAEQHGTQFQYVKSPSFDLNTSAGRRIARILAANDAGEAEDISERLKRERVQAAAAGEWNGGRRPYGYESDGTTVRREEADVILWASNEIATGASLRSLTHEFNERGLLTTAGNQWDTAAVSRMLRRARNAGLRSHNGEIVSKAVWPGVVPEPLWRRVHAILSDPARRTTPGNARVWLGSGLYFCYCGSTVRAHKASGQSRHPKVSYVCSAARHLARVAKPVDAFVREVMIERLSRPDALELLAAEEGEDPTEALERAAQLRAGLDELAAEYGRGSLTMSQLTTASALMRKQLDALEVKIAAAGRASVLAGLIGQPDVAAAWDATDLSRRQAAISRLFRVELWSAGKGRRPGWKPGESYFDPTTVRFVPKS